MCDDLLLAEPILLYGGRTSVGLSAPEVIQDSLDCRIALACPTSTKTDYPARAALRMEMVSAPHIGARKPGDRSQSLNCEAVSARRALRIRRERSTPGGVPHASFRSRCASMLRRSSSDSVCVRRGRFMTMARSVPLEEGGSATGRSHHR